MIDCLLFGWEMSDPQLSLEDVLVQVNITTVLWSLQIIVFFQSMINHTKGGRDSYRRLRYGNRVHNLLVK